MPHTIYGFWIWQRSFHLSTPNRRLLVSVALLIFKHQLGSSQTASFDLKTLPILGKETAPITVVLVEDFKCPVCRAFEEQIAPQLKTRYVDTGQVKVYTLIFPFLAHKFGLVPDDSVLAAQAARCVLKEGGQTDYESFKTVLFRAQGAEDHIWASRERLGELAQNIEDLDQTKFRECFASNATLGEVERDKAAAEQSKVNGTPSAFVNGKLVKYQSFSELQTRLFAAIDVAQKETKVSRNASE